MHELVSYSQLQALREEQVLNILAGVTGTQPVEISEQRLIFAQVKVPEVAVNKKQAQNKQQPQQTKRPSYDQLVRPVSLSDSNDRSKQPSTWTFRSEQTPSASTTATRPGQTAASYISREVVDRPATPEDLTRFNSPDLYKYSYQYVLRGHRFIHGNIIIRLYRFYSSPKSSAPDQAPTEAPQPATLEDLSPIDLSGAWVVDATVRIEDSTNAELMEQAKRELERFRGAMDGAVDFRAPDRLALDTRVRNV